MIFGKEKTELFLGWTDEMVLELLPFSRMKFQGILVQLKTVVHELTTDSDGCYSQTNFTGVLPPEYKGDLKK